MKTRILLNEGEYRLSRAGVMDAKIDAEELYCFLTGCDKVLLFLNKEQEADKETEEKYFQLIEQRASRVPLQHITGKQEFMGFEFKVSPDVLIPRQETEVLVTEAAKTLREERKEAASNKANSRGRLFKLFSNPPSQEVLDLCCGSGAIGISLAKICEDVSVTATDISEAALSLAADNAKANRVDIEFVRGDLFEALTKGDRLDAKAAAAVGCGDVGDRAKNGGAYGKGVRDKALWPDKRKGKGARVRSFDMIISNPPYIRTNSIAMLQEEVKDYEPMTALDGGRDGLDFYRRIIQEAHTYLKEGGWLMFEIGFDQGEELRKMIMETGRFTRPEIIHDLAGRDRIVRCRKQ